VVGMVALRAAFPGLAVTAHALLWIGLLALAALMLLRRHRPAELAAMAAVGFVTVELWLPTFVRVHSARSFFGVHQVVETPDRQVRLLFHGTTIHGAERI